MIAPRGAQSPQDNRMKRIYGWTWL
jgi:hypothetical protein